MSRRWFGTDGIRGRFGEGALTVPFLERLGLALGEQAGRGATVLVARDTRESGPTIVDALAAGLAAAGVEMIDLGVVPTAGLPMAMRARGVRHGAVISASHNPWADNGVKIFGPGGLKLDDATEEAIETRIDELLSDDDAIAEHDVDPTHEDGAAAYRRAVLSAVAGLDLNGMVIAVDCANGSASATAPAVLTSLGAQVTALHDDPDGRNINADCGSTHLDTLARHVAGGHYDLGLAFDGDADRVLMVDARGRTCSGDHMLGLLGTWMAERGTLGGGGVVATVMSNLGLQRFLGRHEIALERTQVGDRHVLAAMLAGGFDVGGEDSGHVLLRMDGELVGDGLFTALTVLRALRDTGRTLADIVDAVARVPQTLINVPVVERPPLDQLPRLAERVAEAERAHGDAIRIVLRYSGTEPLARVMVEGLDADVVESVSADLAALWPDEIEARVGGAR